MRVKRGTTVKKRHKRLKQAVKGMIKSRRASYKKANEAILIARENAYYDRKKKKQNFRSLWIVRLNNALREDGLTYSVFASILKKKNIEVNRKVLSELAVSHPDAFKDFVEKIK